MATNEKFWFGVTSPNHDWVSFVEADNVENAVRAATDDAEVANGDEFEVAPLAAKSFVVVARQRIENI